MAALGLAAWPTWEEWRYRLSPEASQLYSCLGGSEHPGTVDALLSPVRGDLGILVGDVEAFAVPALVVVAAFLGCVGRGDARRTGWRAAACLGVVAVVLPVVAVYGKPESCGVLPILSREWIAGVVNALGWTQVCLLGAAALVVTASGAAREKGTAAGAAEWRRVTALIVDYVILLVVFSFAVQPVLELFGGDQVYLGSGLLNAICLLTSPPDPMVFAVAGLMFVYFWGQHLRWGRTLGKRLLAVRVVAVDGGRPVTAGRLALRTVVFPGLVLVPWAGPVALVAAGLAVLVDPQGRLPHDRVAGTEVAAARSGRYR
ncbi:RDD family protein [Sphaerisporangium rubeum]|uniref:Putative RDD family membrane protein YckC n=1 Tax=Sphaerisporangium rubeum TaxID=321317 RepID=A0A7X0M886_9ACTN|nr:RDD family protein [Sphaerisporangium rubeum]MBB6475355.1 putative RDD family membrane protein YckC [Sphaerisporangium rubeum]